MIKKESGKPHPHWPFNFDKWRLLLKNINFRRFASQSIITEYHLENGKQILLNIWNNNTKSGMQKDEYIKFKEEHPYAEALYVLVSWRDKKNIVKSCLLYFHQDMEEFEKELNFYVQKPFEKWNAERQYDPKFDYFSPK